MVLPASPAPDAHAPTDLIKRLTFILRLADAGVLVLIDQGKPEQLGALVREILPIENDLDVFTRARDLLNAEPGRAVVFVPNVQDAAWLNEGRPILAQRRLRVLMYCNKPEAAEIAHGAPDFFHWISHWMEAPRGFWPPAIHGLRAAERRAEPIVWTMGDFSSAFTASFGEVARIPLSASLPYLDLVKALQTQSEWIVVTDIDGPFRRRRITWALSESGRAGKLVVLDPKGAMDGFVALASVPMALNEAEEHLRAAGAKQAAKLATILDCEPEVIEIAARLLTNGISESDCLAVWQDEDPGVALVRLAEERGIEVPKAAPCVQRAHGAGPRLAIKDWGAAASEATDYGDSDAAKHFARRELETKPADPNASLLLAVVLQDQDQSDESLGLIERALELTQGTDAEDNGRRAFAKFLLSGHYRRRGKLKTARLEIQAAFEQLKNCSEDQQKQFRSMFLLELAEVLVAQGDFQGAKQNANAAIESAFRSGAEKQKLIAAAALELGHSLYLDEDQVDSARTAIERALEIRRELLGEEHTLTLQDWGHLAAIQLLQGKADQAIEILERIIPSLQKLDISIAAMGLITLSQAHFALGQFNEAEKWMTNVMESMHSGIVEFNPVMKARALNDYGGLLLRRGDFTNARQSIERALETMSSTAVSIRFKTAVELNYAYLLMETGDYAKGRAIIEKAHRELLKKYGPNHSLTQDAANLLARIPPTAD